jgi:hypothetical protein
VQALAHLGAAVPAWLKAARLNEMPNLTGVIANARLVCSWVALNSAISADRVATSAVVSTWSQATAARPACRTGWWYGVSWPSR